MRITISYSSIQIIVQLTLALNFQYLGSVEVFDSRGMQVCEEAIKVLKVKTMQRI